MHSPDVFPAHMYPSDASPTSYEDSASSEGVPTPLEGPQSHSNFLNHSSEAPLSIDIPSKITPTIIGTPFITDSSSLFEYPFPPVSARPPLSSASSSSSISSIPGPPSPATVDKHSTHVLARLSNRVGPPGHRKTNSHGGLSPIPIPPRLRKLSGGHIFDESTPTQHDIPTPRFDLSPRPDKQIDNPPSRGPVAARVNSSPPARATFTPGYELGPALSSTPRAGVTDPINGRRRSMPAILSDSGDEYFSASSGTEVPTR